MTELKDSELKKVSGGAMGDVEISDLVESNTGMSCSELLSFFGTLISFAKADGKTQAANDLENILKSGKVNIFKAQVLMSSLSVLKEVAQNHNLTQELEYLNMISL